MLSKDFNFALFNYKLLLYVHAFMKVLDNIHKKRK